MKIQIENKSIHIYIYIKLCAKFYDWFQFYLTLKQIFTFFFFHRNLILKAFFFFKLYINQQLLLCNVLKKKFYEVNTKWIYRNEGLIETCRKWLIGHSRKFGSVKLVTRYILVRISYISIINISRTQNNTRHAILSIKIEHEIFVHIRFQNLGPSENNTC